MATSTVSRITAPALNTVRTDVALLIGRVVVGVVFIAHGWQKLVTNGMPATVDGFTAMGIPLPELSAWFTALVEVVGGAALVLGLLVPLAGLLLAVVSGGALAFVHLENGLFAADGGYELVLVLLAASLMLAGLGSGRFALDPMVFGRRRR
ncbi:DoxX family protein [Nakamurella flavida]|uniref:DoxX family protein n=1 Tax=Nakamurella flavida TaxID=363630 RepID=A0A938YI41_9ACTN|nr:DoxX family protein [Nakamurella flavida]MBM9476347.1 DoxX family protein [Nakamurella flavida]MDP9779553.1 putative oxidoreductase [Nakamurella flavida]